MPDECGQTFMAGTICTKPPGHSGAHGPICGVCNGDWVLGTCTCGVRCNECNEKYLPDESGTPTHCGNCCCDETDADGRPCLLVYEHDGWITQGDIMECLFQAAVDPPTDEELAEVYASLGVPAPPLQ